MVQKKLSQKTKSPNVMGTKSILPGAFERESPNSSNHTNINTLEVRGGARTGKRALHQRGAYYSNVLIPL